MTARYWAGWWRVYGAHPQEVPTFTTESAALQYIKDNT